MYVLRGDNENQLRIDEGSRYWYSDGHNNRHFLQLGNTGDPMSLSSLNRHSLRAALVMTFVIAAGACSDQSITSSDKPVQEPTVNPSQAGMLRGTVREDGTIYFESLDPSIQVGDNGVSGAIYGNQNVTARVSISAYHMDSNATTKTWTLKLAVHNLLNFPVGSVDGSAAPYDTVGMFVFFPSTPRILTPVPCPSCGTISILNTQGTSNFTAPGQPYYYYHDRLAAKGQAGDSTRSNPTWTFSGSHNIKSFSFFVILSAPWPRGVAGGDTTWSVFYNPVVDSLPDVNAKPLWKTIGLSNSAAELLSAGTLQLDANHATNHNSPLCIFFRICTPDDKFFFRSDNLNRTENAYMESKFSLPTSAGGNPVMILGLADSVKFVGLGVGNGKVGFATFNTSSNKWLWYGATFSVTTTGTHTYRIGKFGADSATFYVDGVAKLTAANVVIPANFMPTYSGSVPAQATKLSSMFGITAQDADANATISYVTYAFHATPKP